LQLFTKELPSITKLNCAINCVANWKTLDIIHNKSGDISITVQNSSNEYSFHAFEVV